MYYKLDDDIMDNKSEDNSGFAELRVYVLVIKFTYLLNFYIYIYIYMQEKKITTARLFEKRDMDDF